MTNETSTSGQSPEELFQERIRRVEDAVSLKDRKSTRLNSSHSGESRMPSSA